MNNEQKHDPAKKGFWEGLGFACVIIAFFGGIALIRWVS